MEISETQTMQVTQGIVWRKLDDNTVVVSPQTGQVRVLNGVGSTIWQLLVDENTPSEIQNHLVNHYNVAPDQAGKDVHNFLVDLHDKGLLE